MSCSCNISPPCSYCVQTYECDNCGDIKHPDDDGLGQFSDRPDKNFCDKCFEDICNE